MEKGKKGRQGKKKETTTKMKKKGHPDIGGPRKGESGMETLKRGTAKGKKNGQGEAKSQRGSETKVEKPVKKPARNEPKARGEGGKNGGWTRKGRKKSHPSENN